MYRVDYICPKCKEEQVNIFNNPEELNKYAFDLAEKHIPGGVCEKCYEKWQNYKVTIKKYCIKAMNDFWEDTGYRVEPLGMDIYNHTIKKSEKD